MWRSQTRLVRSGDSCVSLNSSTPVQLHIGWCCRRWFINHQHNVFSNILYLLHPTHFLQAPVSERHGQTLALNNRRVFWDEKQWDKTQTSTRISPCSIWWQLVSIRSIFFIYLQVTAYMCDSFNEIPFKKANLLTSLCLIYCMNE